MMPRNANAYLRKRKIDALGLGMRRITARKSKKLKGASNIIKRNLLMRQSKQRRKQMSRPKRIQRKRTKGWKMPANTVYVGRPSKWGNPFYVGASLVPSHERAMSLFDDALHGRMGRLKISVEEVRRELKGKNLACWCAKGLPCHASILLEIANE